jgi:hypothetical protein
MTEQRPSKELFSDLSLLRASGFDDAADEIQRLQRENDTCGLQCSATMKSLVAENEKLRTALTGIASCSTCEACRGAARLALGERTVAEIHAAVDERLDRVERELAEAWFPIETAPKDGTPILGYVLPPRMQASLEGPRVVKWAGEYGMWSMPGISGLSCSHWMPLPARPAQPPGDGQ